VIRINFLGELVNSRPCACCVDYLKDLGFIRYVYYSNEHGEIVRERISEMISTHLSIGTRKIIKNGNVSHYLKYRHLLPDSYFDTTDS